MERTVITPLGPLLLRSQGEALTGLEWAAGGMDGSPLLLEAERQLLAYFSGRLRQFELPLSPAGTAFQQQVWAALRDVPYGETCSYGALAAGIGKPGAARAVGMANHANPLPIFLPCHRVIGADGSLTGYGGGLEKKQYLLALEAQCCAQRPTGKRA